MIHYTCDCCKRRINAADELRYIVRLEVYAALDPLEDEADDDRDHLQEIQDVLERMDDPDDDVCDEVYQQKKYDLCSECRQRYLKNPLAQAAMQELGFSQN